MVSARGSHFLPRRRSWEQNYWHSSAKQIWQAATGHEVEWTRKNHACTSNTFQGRHIDSSPKIRSERNYACGNGSQCLCSAGRHTKNRQSREILCYWLHRIQNNGDLLYVHVCIDSIVQYVSECPDQTRFSYQGMAFGHAASWDSSTKRYIRYNTWQHSAKQCGIPNFRWWNSKQDGQGGNKSALSNCCRAWGRSSAYQSNASVRTSMTKVSWTAGICGQLPEKLHTNTSP